MKIILLRMTKKNAFFLVDNKNLIVPEDHVGLTGLSKRVFGKHDENDENSNVGEYFIQYTVDDPYTRDGKYVESRVIQIIHKIPMGEFLSNRQGYTEGVDCWIPSIKDLRKGWITPF